MPLETIRKRNPERFAGTAQNRLSHITADGIPIDCVATFSGP